MTLTVELSPEIEQRLLSEARARGMTLGRYVQEFLTRGGVFAERTPPRSTEDLNRAFDEAADLVPNSPPLSDYAMSRESIYTREDEW